MRTRAERSRRAESVESSRQSGRSSQPKSQDSGIVLEESSDQGQDHQNPQLRSRSGKEEVRKNHKKPITSTLIIPQTRRPVVFTHLTTHEKTCYCLIVSYYPIEIV